MQRPAGTTVIRQWLLRYIIHAREVPEHLLKRARERRAAIEQGAPEPSPERSGKIPLHFLRGGQLPTAPESQEEPEYMPVPKGMDRLSASFVLEQFIAGQLIEIPPELGPELAAAILESYAQRIRDKTAQAHPDPEPG